MKRVASILIAIFVGCNYVIAFEKFKVDLGTQFGNQPLLYGDNLVYKNYTSGGINHAIYHKDLSTNGQIQVVNSFFQQPYVVNDIYGDNIVIGYRTGPHSYYSRFYVYNTVMQENLGPSSAWHDYKYSPSIYENTIVYTAADFISGSGRGGVLGPVDLYAYDLTTATEIKITEDGYRQQDADVFGDTVVWLDERNGDWDVYGFDLSTSTEFRITHDIASPSGNDLLRVYGNTVIWGDERNSGIDLYGYDLSTFTEFRITHSQSVVGGLELYDDIVVWEDNRNGNSDIYGYDLMDSVEFSIATDSNDQINPYIYEDIVLWQEGRSFNSEIYGAVIPEPSMYAVILGVGMLLFLVYQKTSSR